MTHNLSASTEFGHVTLVGKEKTHSGGMFLFGCYRLCDSCESQLPENKESKEHNKETERVQPDATSVQLHHCFLTYQKSFCGETYLMFTPFMQQTSKRNTFQQDICILAGTTVTFM